MFRKIIFIFLLAQLTLPVSAQWTVDAERSTISCLSSKALPGGLAIKTEDNKFNTISGAIAPDGSVVITIQANSVDTGNKQRDKLVAQHIFLANEYPEITIFLNIKEREVNKVYKHDTYTGDAEIRMRGISKTFPVSVIVNTDSEDKNMHVYTSRPIMFEALEYDTGPGFLVLEKMVGLANIATTIPVNVDLHFVHQ